MFLAACGPVPEMTCPVAGWELYCAGTGLNPGLKLWVVLVVTLPRQLPRCCAVTGVPASVGSLIGNVPGGLRAGPGDDLPRRRVDRGANANERANLEPRTQNPEPIKADCAARSARCRRAGSRRASLGVSMRTIASNAFSEPSPDRILTCNGCPGTSSCATPVTSKVSKPVSWRLSADIPAANSRGKTPMPMRLLRWMRSKLSASTTRTPSSRVPLAAQSRDEPEPYSFPAITIRGVPPSYVTHGCVINGEYFRALLHSGVAPLNTRGQLVTKPDVGKGPPHHDFVVAAPGTEGVELPGLDSMAHQILTGGPVLGNCAGRRNVVGRHRISQ